MVLTISTTKFFLAEISLVDYNFHRWTCKPTEIYSVNSKQTCKPPELHTIIKKCNGTGLLLKICEMKNNVWKKHELSIPNGIDNYIKITKIKLDSASLNSKQSFINGVNKPFMGLFFYRDTYMIPVLIVPQILVDTKQIYLRCFLLSHLFVPLIISNDYC